MKNEFKYKNLILIQGDITKCETEAIVNAANSHLAHGGGVALAISKAAGPSLQEESNKIIAENGPIPTGSATITSGGKLKAKYVIHAVGPIYSRYSSEKAAKLLESTYKSSLELALKNNIKTIAFPSISTGIYGYPIEEASYIALKTLIKYLDKFDKIYMVLYSKKDFEIYKKTLEKIINEITK